MEGKMQKQVNAVWVMEQEAPDLITRVIEAAAAQLSFADTVKLVDLGFEAKKFGQLKELLK
jgi:hypothetical protein